MTMAEKTKKEKREKILYRPNVAIILERSDGRILIGRRVDQPETWQFPQGGVDAGESSEDALYREVHEELSLSHKNYAILEKRGPYRYIFPNGVLKKGIYRGQSQTYFRCVFQGASGDLDWRTPKPEFSEVRWIRPQDFRLSWIPEFKHGVYSQVFLDFFSLKVLV